MSLRKLFSEKKQENEFRLPDDYEVSCNDCDWKGEIKDCPTEWESDGWEYPEYEVLICPNCNEGDINI